MKKFTVLLAVLVLLMIPVSAFAGDGIWIGPTAMYDYDMTLEEISNLDPDMISMDNLTYGLEARLDISLFQASVNAYYYPTFISPDYSALRIASNVGIYADLGIVGLGLSAGPQFLSVISDDDVTDPMEIGSTIKVAADLILGDLLFSSYFLVSEDDLSEVDWENYDVMNAEGQLGVSVLMRL